ncbi:hypothetical protein BTA51_14910 [Hahella sp. CCB-MM4]|uniref:DMT family transporter n=1 Tax=Hahella sp. (strain CCB-MM4) TaxID=1926491 RepID=UPI000B9AD689|nr:DMT family transporter [Hahella sp. CCB-MM4]OZG72419.1 hypothetical protein BTA51_14910 [Hahella sp. CCB-MM4]
MESPAKALPSEGYALVAAVMTSLTWSLTGIFVRLLPPISPLTITAGRLFIALLAMIPLMLLASGPRGGLISALRHPSAYLLSSFLVGYYFLATAAFQYAPVAEVTLLLSTPPLFVLFFRWLKRDIPARTELAGAAMAVAGMAIIMAPGFSVESGLSSTHLYGDAIATCAAALTALYAFIFRGLSEQSRAPESTGVSMLTFIVGTVLLTAAMAVTPLPSGLNSIQPDSVVIFLGLGILSTAIPTLGFALASNKLPAVVTATIPLFVPLLAGLIAFVVLGEHLSDYFVIGGMLVLAGVALIIQRNRRPPMTVNAANIRTGGFPDE